ncbi:MAG: putative S-layer protein [Nanoarchaeota archaeon]|nr:putative S-layer protein [Nanoarchaeota archaeon]
MNTIKLFVVLVLSFFLLGASANLAYAADIDIRTPTSPSGNPSTTVTVSFTAENQHATDSRTIIFQSTELMHITDNSYKMPAPIISSITLDAGAQQTVSFNVNFPITLSGVYKATITAQDASNAANKDTMDYTLNVNPVGGITVSGLDGNKLKFSGPEDSEISNTFTIKNTGSIPYTPTLTITGDFEDTDENLITFDVASIGTIKTGETKTVTVTTLIPDGMTIDKYTGTVDITTGTTATSTFNIEIDVEPQTCSDGRVSDGDFISGPTVGNIRVEIDEPNDGDDFKPGDTIEIKVDVKNEGSDDYDVIVEAILYNIDTDEEVASVESDSEKVKEDKKQTFELNLEIPSDEDLDTDDTYMLYIKAYDDGNEDEDCNYDSVGLDFKRNNYDVIIDSFDIAPQIASCGSIVSFKVGVLNIGEKDQDDVYIRLSAPSLGIDQQSSKFDLDDYSGNDNDMVTTFTFATPKDASEGEHPVEAFVYFRDGKSSKSKMGTLTLKSCQAQGSGATINAPKTSFTINAGSVLTIPFTVKNNEATSKTYFVEVMATGWGESVTQQATLSAGQEATTYAYVNVNIDTGAGDYVAVINVKDGSSLIASKNINVKVESTTTPTGGTTYKPTTTWGSFWRNLSNSATALVVGVLILVVLVVLLIVILTRR